MLLSLEWEPFEDVRVCSVMSGDGTSVCPRPKLFTVSELFSCFGAFTACAPSVLSFRRQEIAAYVVVICNFVCQRVNA